MAGWLLAIVVGCGAGGAGGDTPDAARMPDVAGCTRRWEEHTAGGAGEGPPRLVETRYDAEGRVYDEIVTDLDEVALSRSWWRTWSTWDEQGCLVRELREAHAAPAPPGRGELQWRCREGYPEARRWTWWEAGVKVWEETSRVRVEVEGGHVVYSATEDPEFGWVGAWYEWGEHGRTRRSAFMGDVVTEVETWAYDPEGHVTLHAVESDTGAVAQRTVYDEVGRPAWAQVSRTDPDGASDWRLYRYHWSATQYTPEEIEISGSRMNGVARQAWTCTEGWPWSCEIRSFDTHGQASASWVRDTWTCGGAQAPGVPATDWEPGA